MGRERNPNRRKAFEMWKESSGTLSLKDIAAALVFGNIYRNDKYIAEIKHHIKKFSAFWY
ncbi:phage terminase small subunit-related protein [Aneurinibacillus thermoaerophilus]|uniref:PBSX phage terminase small subunit-like N-terminal domain-containing protein n=1 Tax=Aneurinibacillus thermoaerophilus TaxID=143495 RepID=A0ABX8YE52_ANETH|nr:phage terminase small subunit-related protein [Aneurinibacillus thermoaerophilus]QYY43988.1 hypothetical protein K3F53_07340 [Aneurinibacillus thermoaerophilus]